MYHDVRNFFLRSCEYCTNSCSSTAPLTFISLYGPVGEVNPESTQSIEPGKLNPVSSAKLCKRIHQYLGIKAVRLKTSFYVPGITMSSSVKKA